MIRINLLPQKRETRQEASQTWLLVLMGVLFLEGVALFFLHESKNRELEAHKRTNQEIQQQINEIQKTVANHAQVKAQLAEFKNREEAIKKLQTARSGPTNVLLELAKVLTPGKMPTIDPDKLAQMRRDNPLAVPNPGWDSRRLWLTTYKETERTLLIEGLARDGDDVSELARRLSLSDFFQDVKLLPASKVSDTSRGTKVEMLKFQLQAKVKYLWPPQQPSPPPADSLACPWRPRSASVLASSSWSAWPISSWATARSRARSPLKNASRSPCASSSRARRTARPPTSRTSPS